MKVIGIITSTIICMAYVTLLRGFTISWIWEWHLRDLLGLRSISIFDGIGIALFASVTCLTRQVYPKYKSTTGTLELEPVTDKTAAGIMLNAAGFTTCYCLLSLLIGWIAS